MNTTKGNKIIAEFIGWEKSQQLIGGYCAFNEECYQVLPKEMLFNTSWDWLMPVVEKIESFGFKTTIENKFCSIDGTSDDTIGIWFETNNPPINKIDATYQACVEFIKWYNENKPQ